MTKIVISAIVMIFVSCASSVAQDAEFVKRAMRTAMPSSAYCEAPKEGLVCVYSEDDGQVSFLMKSGSILARSKSPVRTAGMKSKLDGIVFNFATQFGFSRQEAEACFARMLLAMMQQKANQTAEVPWESPTVGIISNKSYSLRCRQYNDGTVVIFETMLVPTF